MKRQLSMKRMAVTALAASLAAVSAAAYAHGGHGPGVHCADGGAAAPMAWQHARGMGGLRAPEAVAQHLTGVKEALKLQPTQTAAWDAFEAKVRSNAETRAKMRDGLAERRGNADALAEYRVWMMKVNAQLAEETLALRKALVAVLTPEQKATFDQVGPGMGMRGMHRQDGYGRGWRPAAPTAS